MIFSEDASAFVQREMLEVMLTGPADSDECFAHGLECPKSDKGPHLPTGSVSTGDLPLALADWRENKMFSRLKVALEFWSLSAT